MIRHNGYPSQKYHLKLKLQTSISSIFLLLLVLRLNFTLTFQLPLLLHNLPHSRNKNQYINVNLPREQLITRHEKVATSTSFEKKGDERSLMGTNDLLTNFAHSNENLSNNFLTKQSPLSMNIEQLTAKLGGKGRSLAAWDCYRIGLDPFFFHDPLFSQEALDNSIHMLPISNHDNDNNKIQGIINTRTELQNYFPSKRRNLRLALKSLESLSNLYSSPLRGIENSIAKLVKIQTSKDGTTKLLLNLYSSPAHNIETVIIPWEERGSSTLCVSSQVGCRQGCTFCATGRMGKLLDLTTDEILIQLYYANKLCRIRNLPTVDNIVFMGMGEPTDNMQSVASAVNLMVEKNCFSISPSKITVSTVGPNPDVFRKLTKVPAVLAWSIHAVRDSLRKELVPTTKYTMEELREGMVNCLKVRPKKMRTLMLEVALIQNVNDSEREALELATFSLKLIELVGDMKLTVNLIPFNEVEHNRFQKPSVARILAFQKVLRDKGLMAYVRRTRGDDEHAACGQLATAKKKGITRLP